MADHLYLGSEIPEFCLIDENGSPFSKAHLLGAPAILMFFISYNCPYFLHIQQVLYKLIQEYVNRGIAALGVNLTRSDQFSLKSTGINRSIQILGMNFSFVYDPDLVVVKQLNVRYTPDFFVFNKAGKLIYHGQMDGSRPENKIPVTGSDLRNALEAALNNTKPHSVQQASYGSWISLDF